MKKQIRLNALDMNCVGGCPGLWLHPQDKTLGYNTLGYWTELAQLLERGLVDSLFIADIFGVYDVFGGNAGAAFRNAVEFPVNDPFLLVPAMAMVTKHLGFGITGTVTYEPPFSFARRLSTLDHLTNGRIAWNIVTGYLDSAARAFGLEQQPRHDERYVLAEEFMEVVYKLWEGSWEDDAAVRDKGKGIFAYPEKIHKVQHQGRYFRMEGYHLCEPSPQRTPVLFQAGGSPRGRQFAAQHAECVFVSGHSPLVVAEIVTDLRARALQLGRDPASLTIYAALTVIAGETDDVAKDKLADYQRHVSTEGSLALLSGYLGIDFASRNLDEPLEASAINAIQGCMHDFADARPGRRYTLREAAASMGVAAHKPLLAGSAKTVADGLMEWVEVSGIDGFNLEHIVCPGDFEAFVDLVVPELQDRGVYKTQYADGSLREKLNGKGKSRLPADHPGASYRFRPGGQ